MTRVLLVRHGQSTWNADGRWQGQADPPLSVRGEQQARAVADALAAVDAVWASDLARARRTAELLLSPRGELHLDVRLRERHVGSWTGLTRDEIEVRHPGWLRDGRRPAGWEGDEALGARAWPVLREIADALPPGGTAVVVSHGGFIRTVEAGLGAPGRPIENLGGVWLHCDGDDFTLGPRAVLAESAAVTSDTGSAAPPG